MTIIRHDLTAVHDEDWNHSFWLVDGTWARDLTGATLRLTIRPLYDHAAQIKVLTSDTGGGIVIDSAANGAASIFLAQVAVATDLPVSPSQGWDQFLQVIYGSGAVEECWRGSLTVLPGKTS